MLKAFSVSNFKNFEGKITLELDHPANYEFNKEIIKNNCITKAVIYGINGSGKSNLALALFDIILHLTDKERALDKYQLYKNLQSGKEAVEFEYLFHFDGIEVRYLYSKKTPSSLLNEELYIDGAEVLKYDHVLQKGFCKLKGTETLQINAPSLSEMQSLSRVKYVKSNAILEDNNINRAFISFTSFVDRMLMFYSLTENRYQGLIVGPESYTQGIINAGKIKEFETFLKDQGVKYDLVAIDVNGSSELFCNFTNGQVPFVSIASTGTRSMALFYYWYLKMNEASFVYIDEYDAFYHFELAQEIIRLVKRLPNTQIILSTHNTDLISNDLLRPDAYYLISNNTIRSFDKITEKELRKAHNIQKMYKAGAFNE